MFNSVFEKVKSWYFRLPWWGKLLGFLVLVLLVVLVILKFVLGGRTPDKPISDIVHTNGVATVIKAGTKEDEELGTAIAATQTEIGKVEEAKETITGNNANAHDAINAANSFAAVDKVIKTLIFVLLMSLPAVANAQVVYEMPTGKDVVLNGIPMRAYTLDEYKVMANIYVDYRSLLDLKIQADKELVLYLDMKSLYEQKDANCKDMTLTMTNDRDYWKARYEETAKDKSFVIERVGWIGAVVLEAVALVVWGAVDLTQ
jgi:hypothetical protein